jgi:AraC-like DNA-binding protein
MGMTGRSFRRQLATEHTSFRALLDKARYLKAASYLQNEQFSIDYIAQQLGYSEAAAFNHAFLRWSGMSPSAYRNKTSFSGARGLG